MKKHLYEIKRLDIPAYLKWWFIKYRNAGTLSEVLENLTSPITLQNSLRRKFKIFEIGGNSVQNGEPTPTNPVPIQNVTGDVEVKVENKNLALIRTDLRPFGASVTTTVLQADSSGKRRGTLLQVKENTSYRLYRQNSISQGYNRCFFFDKYPILNETMSIGGRYFDAGNNYSTIITTPPRNKVFIYTMDFGQ